MIKYKWMRSAMAAVLIICVMAAALVFAPKSIAETQAVELVKNGTFDTGDDLSQWSSNSASYKIFESTTYPSKTFCLWQSSNSISDTKYVDLTLSAADGILADTTYSVSFDAASGNVGSKKLNYQIFSVDSANQLTSLTEKQTDVLNGAANKTFISFSQDVTLPSNAVGLKVRFWSNSIYSSRDTDDANKVVLDNVSVKQNDYPELVVDGDFENNSVLSGEVWTADSVYAVSNERVAKGSHSLKASLTSTDWRDATVKIDGIKAETTYQVSFKEYSTHWSAEFQYYMGTTSKGADIFDMRSTGTAYTVGAFGNYGFTFRVAEGISTVYLTFHSRSHNGGDVSLYFDDISVKEKEYEVDEYELLSNPSFETGDTNGWQITGDTAQVVRNNKYSGKYSLNITAGDSLVSLKQSVNVEQGCDYNFQVFVKVESGSGAATVKIDGTEVLTVTNSSDKWTQYSYTYNSNKNATVEIETEVENLSLWIDDYSFSELIFGSVKDGGFESGSLYGKQWIVSEGFSVTDRYANGNYSLQFTQSEKKWEDAVLCVEVTPGGIYDIGFVCCYSNWRAEIQYYIGSTKGGQDIVPCTIIDSGLPPKEWINVAHTVKLSDTTEKIYITIHSRNTDADKSENYSFYDDFYVTEQVPTVPQGEFEDDNLDKWTVSDENVSISDEEAYVGNNSLHFSSEASGAFISQIVEIKPNTDYAFSFYSKGQTGNGGNPVYSLSGISSTVLSEEIDDLSDVWTQHKLLFNSGNSDKVTVKIQNTNAVLYIDTVHIKEVNNTLYRAYYTGELGKKPYTEDSNNLVASNTLEKALTSGFTVNSEGFDDDNAIMFSGTGEAALFAYKVFVVPNTDYTFSFYSKALATGNLQVGIACDSEGMPLKDARFVTPETASWSFCGYTFNSGDNNTLWLYMSGSTGICLLDNISVFKTSDGVSDLPNLAHITEWKTSNRVLKDNGVNLFANGNFDNGVSDFSGGIITSEKANSGSNSLKFTANGEKTVYKFTVSVEKNTEYVLSAFVAGMPGSDLDMTYGVINPKTGNFIMPLSTYPTSTGEVTANATADHCLTPPAWDGTWYRRGLTFNTMGLGSVEIVIVGTNSTAYFDDFLLCKKSDSIEALNTDTTISATAISESQMDCADANNLISDGSFSQKSHTAWESSINYGKFLDIREAFSGENALVTYESKRGTNIYYIRWIDVTPNTQYNFSVIAKMITDEGVASFGLITDDYKPQIIQGYTNISDEWAAYGFTFNSGSYNKVGVYICDTGSTYIMDDFRLFESKHARSFDHSVLDLRNSSDSDILEEDVEETDELEKEETNAVSSEKIKTTVEKKIVGATDWGVSTPVLVLIIVGGWLLIAALIWLIISFFTKTSVFSFRKK